MKVSIAFLNLPHFCQGLIRTCVVDEDDFIGLLQGLHHAFDIVIERPNVSLLIVHGRNDGILD